MSSKPIWFIFPGSDSLPSNPRLLLEFGPFLDLCEQFKLNYDIDLIGNLKKSIQHQQQSSDLELDTGTGFALITAFQVALTTHLAKLGVHPDGYIGYSIGEFGCAFADGFYTAMETLLLSYNLGRSIEDGRGVKGTMARVYASRSKLPLRCDEKVYVVGEDGPNVTTVSGERSDVQRFLKRLSQESGSQLTAKPLNSFNNALHTPEMDFLWESAKESLYQIISVPQVRSDRWVSTNGGSADDYLRLVCPRYFVRNLTSSVLFSKAVTRVPDNALLIEMSLTNVLKDVLRDNQRLNSGTVQNSKTIEGCFLSGKDILTEGHLLQAAECTTTG